jgi:hypothetical protein
MSCSEPAPNAANLHGKGDGERLARRRASVAQHIAAVIVVRFLMLVSPSLRVVKGRC